MPYKSGKLKGELTTTEIRRLIKAHNVLVSIKIPVGSKREDIIKIVEDRGYKIDHKKQKLMKTSKAKLPDKIDLPPPPKKLTKEEKLKKKKETAEKKAQQRIKTLKDAEKQKEALRKLKEARKKKKKDLVRKIPKAPPAPAPSKKPKAPPRVKPPSGDGRGQTASQKEKEYCRKIVRYSDDYIEGHKRKFNKQYTKDMAGDRDELEIRFKVELNFSRFKINFEKIRNICGSQEANKYKKAYSLYSAMNEGKNTKRYLPEEKKEKPKPEPKPDDDGDEVAPDDVVGQDELTEEQKKEITDMSPETIMEDYVKNKIDYFVPYVGNENVILLYMVYILEINKNDCSITEELLKKFVNNSGGAKKVLKDNSDEVAKAIIRCMKRKKLLAVPVYFSGHANMLTFNYHRGEVERFEPNGVVKGKRDNMALNPALKVVNTKLKELVNQDASGLTDEQITLLKKGFKYLDPQSVSASESRVLAGKDRFENYQLQETQVGADGTKRGRGGTSRQYGGVVITEAGGYCVAFSFMYLDLRLKFPKMSASDIIDRTLKKLGTNRGDGEMVKLIAGQTNLLYQNGRKMIDEGYMSEETFIKATSSQYFKKDPTLKQYFYATPANTDFIEGTRKYLTDKGVWARMTS